MDGADVHAPRPGDGAVSVLIVENHADTRLSMQVLLDSLGYRVMATENCAEALASSARWRFDVLLSDISLPDGDGWELLEQLRARGCPPRHAIAMSGLSGVTDHARSRAAGFELHLVKPFASEELQEAISGVVSRETVAAFAEATDNSPAPEPGFHARLAQRMHDSLCQDLAAAALWQGALIRRLEKAPLEGAVAEAQQVSQLLDNVLNETRALMRELRGD